VIRFTNVNLGVAKEVEKRVVAFDNKRPLWQCGPCGGISSKYGKEK